jgi:hypothetical protein
MALLLDALFGAAAVAGAVGTAMNLHLLITHRAEDARAESSVRRERWQQLRYCLVALVSGVSFLMIKSTDTAEWLSAGFAFAILILNVGLWLRSRTEGTSPGAPAGPS